MSKYAGREKRMNPSTMEYAHEFMQVYDLRSKEARREFDLTQTAFDIVLFLANNPQYHTARDIVEVRRLKANLVSVNVDKLVSEGYLVREPIPGDRRKVALALTEKAGPVVERGRAFQKAFFDELAEGVCEEDRACFFRILEQVKINMDKILEGAKGK